MEKSLVKWAPGQYLECISKEVLYKAHWERKGVVVLKCQPITFYVGHDISLDPLVQITLDVECAIQHDKSSPAMTVH